MEERKKTAREIIEGYQGPPVPDHGGLRNTYPRDLPSGDPQASAAAGGADLRTGMSGLCNTGRGLLTRPFILLWKNR